MGYAEPVNAAEFRRLIERPALARHKLYLNLNEASRRYHMQGFVEVPGRELRPAIPEFD